MHPETDLMTEKLMIEDVPGPEPRMGDEMSDPTAPSLAGSLWDL
jgi:hypothetical protein